MNDQDTTEKLLVALRHPVRREMLERVVRQDAPVSPKDLAGHLGMPLSNVSYHARVLVECDVLDLVDTKPRRGSIQHFYKPSGLADHPMVTAALGLDNGSGGAS